MKLVAYSSDDEYYTSLLLRDYMLEMEGVCEGNTIKALHQMIETNRHIYVLYRDDEAIGFIVMYVNDQYGLLPAVAVNEYMYIKPKYRTSLATKYMLLQLLDYCRQLQLPLMGYTYNSSSNVSNSKALDSEELGIIYKVPLKNMINKLNKLRK